MPETLARIAFWSRELTEAERARAARGVIEKSVSEGGYLIHKGERFDPWVGVVDGLLKLSTSSASGKTATLAGISSGGWFGEGSILKNEARRYDVTALRDTRIALMDRPTFLWLYEHSTGFNRFLVRQLNERLGQFMAMVEQARILDATGRVAHALAMLLNPIFYPDAGLHVKISQEEVGLLSGISRQSANQALRLLEETGLIRCEKGGITVNNLEKLARYGG